MIFQIIAVLILIVFYSFYFAKIIIQKRQSIKTNQMGKGNKPKKVLLIERILSVTTISAVIGGVCSIFLVKDYLHSEIRIIGIVTGVIAILFFASAVNIMKNSWRVGIPEEKTALVTSGIYNFSRNPAFVGFDLLYLSLCLMFFNIPLIVISIFAAAMLHIQILQEEEYMHITFGAEYDEYKKHIKRYLGRRLINEN